MVEGWKKRGALSALVTRNSSFVTFFGAFICFLEQSLRCRAGCEPNANPAWVCVPASCPESACRQAVFGNRSPQNPTPTQSGGPGERLWDRREADAGLPEANPL